VARTPTDIRSLARAYGKRGIQILGGLAETAESEDTRIRAVNILLERGYGKPIQQHTHGGGEDGSGPIVVEVIHRERKKK
jgi:hypothetical protein